MENYIIRIYRRDHGIPGKMTGLLESVERETRTPFQSLNELSTMLATAGTVEPSHHKQTALERDD